MSFEGSIGEIDLIQRFVELGREHFTGAIRFEQDGIIKIIYFKGGDVLSASTNDRKDAIDEILLRAGKVGREHIKQALAKRQENETLGDALLNLGFITRKELTWARRVQVIGILRSVRSWTDGTYAIVADYLPKRDEGTIFPLAQIIVEFIVTEQDRAAFDRAMEGGEAVFRKSASFDEAFVSLDLNEDAAEIVKHLDGERSAAEIAGVSGAEAFNVYKLLEALRILGVIEKAGAASDAPAIAIPPQAEAFSFGVTDPMAATEAWETAPAPTAAETLTPPDPEPQVTLQPSAPAAEQHAEMPIIPPPVPQPAPEEKGWGFDDAQIEAARRATAPRAAVPPRRPTLTNRAVPKKKSSSVAATAVVALVLLAAAGGWWWWKGRSEPESAPVAATPAKRPVIQPAPPSVDTTATVVSATSTTATSTASAATPATTASAPVATSKTTPATKARVETQAQGGRMITNVPTPPSSDAGRAKYDAMARQFAQNPAGTYTVQFELVCQTASLAKAVSAGGANVWFLPTDYRGQSCYRVFWGRYDSRDAAIAALGKIPSSLRGSSPVVINIPRS
jgi:cytoskeletal protein RodZ